jgi:GT2 family glycosyltransferase
MKLSIIVLCWNDQHVIANCLRSIYSNTHSTEFEIIVSDNGSTDRSVEFIRKSYPKVRLIENGSNLRFAKANNIGIRASTGEYVLILNPDTIIHDGTLDRLIRFADEHKEAGAFGCRVLNADGSYQESGRPFPTFRGEWVRALGLKPLAYISDWFLPGIYVGWKGDTERKVDWLSGCFILARKEILTHIGGFDEQFFYYFEDMDLCRRIWEAGYPAIYTPQMTITHLGGQSTKRSPLKFVLDSQVTRYRYFYKYHGRRGVRHYRWIALTSLALRLLTQRLTQFVRPTETRRSRLESIRATFHWNVRVDPVRLAENGEEPERDVRPIDQVLSG